MKVKTNIKKLVPQNGKTVQVIGAGLPRTGSNSFCAALSILLDGPAYHVGVQTTLSANDETCPRNWIRMMKMWPPSDTLQKKEFSGRLAKELDGFVATADPPASLLVPELMELYPDAKVLCTIRDKEKWVPSMMRIQKLIIPFPVGKILYFWIPTLRYMPAVWATLPGIFAARHGETITDAASAERIYNRHHAWLEEIVPKEKLFYINVKDGWEPLCKALGLEVPRNIDFPRLNESKDMEDLFKDLAIQGLQRWGMAILGIGFVVTVIYWIYPK